MVQPTYHIMPDVAGAFLRIDLAGDWDAEITARFTADVTKTLREMLAGGLRQGELRTLIDMRDKNILPRHLVAEFARLVRPDSPSKQIALVVSSALHRLQTKRVADERSRLFDTEAEALAWLGMDQRTALLAMTS
ncbi:hypothetical protein [uncultured Sphingomonas sp.]|uniref:hypothetical protein n=1 Tax=uncultured Sphingomonas sp. TaxID=158754 RepID=UPI0025FED858|nr:hypothetical protein [uncultured Sphingomonas sp.]